MSRICGSVWALGAVGVLAAAGAARRRGSSNEPQPFHIAGSWDWNNWTQTYWGTDLDDAISNIGNPRSMAADVAGWGDEPAEYLDDSRHQIYAVIRGGRVQDGSPPKRRSLRGERTSGVSGLEGDTKVWVVWQAEYDIEVESVTPREAGTYEINALVRAAWDKLGGADAFTYEGDDEDGYFPPDMVVVGGDLELTGDLR